MKIGILIAGLPSEELDGATQTSRSKVPCGASTSRASLPSPASATHPSVEFESGLVALL